MKVQPETIDDKWNDTHKHYYNTTQPLSSWVPNCFSISCNILWNTTSTSCEQWVCVWVCVSEWVSVCMWVSAYITILLNNSFSLSLSPPSQYPSLSFCFLFSLIYIHTQTFSGFNWLTSFCLADDSIKETFHSLASFFPISNVTTLCMWRSRLFPTSTIGTLWKWIEHKTIEINLILPPKLLSCSKEKTEINDQCITC